VLHVSTVAEFMYFAQTGGLILRDIFTFALAMVPTPLNEVLSKKYCTITPYLLRRGSAAARLLGLWVRIPPGGMDVCLLRVLCVVR
jgi:hypothetical protein